MTEVLDYVPACFRVIRHVRPKLSCRRCESIAQAPVPSLPIQRGLATPALLAHVLVAKYADHCPLYRQAEIYARAGVELDRSTLADWVGQSARLLRPLVNALGAHVMAAERIYADDTTVPVLDPGRGKTKTGRLWCYVRDDRPFAGTAPPAVLYHYSPDRKGEHPRRHLAGFHGILQADGYAGYAGLYEHGVTEAACMAHCRRPFFELHASTGSPLALEALQRIAALYAIEATIRGEPPEARLAARQAQSAPLFSDLRTWLETTQTRISGKSDLAGAIRYMLSRWTAPVVIRCGMVAMRAPSTPHFGRSTKMTPEHYGLIVRAEDQATAGRAAKALSDVLREADGVLEAECIKADSHTMDLGTIISVLATSGTTLALARGLAAWLTARRGVTVTVERDGKSGSLKAAVAGINPEAAVRIVEMVRKG